MELSYEPREPGAYTAAEIDELVQTGEAHHWVQNHLAQDVTASGAPGSWSRAKAPPSTT